MTAARRTLGTALAIACVLALVACGGTDARRATAAAAVSQTYLDVSKNTVKLTASQASCLGTGIVDDFGVDRSVKYGFLTKDLKPVSSLSLTLSTQDAARYADLYLTCADPATAIKNALVAAIAPQSAAAEARLRGCLDRTLTRALMRKALQAAASGDTSNASLSPLYAACGKLG